MNQTNTKNIQPIANSCSLPIFLRGFWLFSCLWLIVLPVAAQEYIYKSQFGTRGSGDGQFESPTGVIVDGQGNVYVADYENHRIQKFDAQGTFLAKFGTQGSGDGQLQLPIGVYVDGQGNVYVADFGNHRVQIFAPVTTSNTAPELAAIGSKTIAVAATLAFTVSATDTDIPAQSLIYSASPLPAGATFNAATRTFSWTPTGKQAGSYNLTFQVSDGELTDAEAITIAVVKPQDQKATIISFLPVSGPVGTQVTIIGTNLLSTTQVTFNGKIATNLQVVNATTVKATVPTGAKSGKIALTTTSGNVSSTTKFTVTGGLTASSVEEQGVEQEYALVAYPNPFSGKAIIEFALVQSEEYSAVLYDAKGAKVALLKEGTAAAGTTQTLEIDGTTLTKGLYLVRLQTREGVRTMKLVLTK